MGDYEFREGLLDHPQVIALLEQHLREMHSASPIESVHALDLDELRGEQLSFWTLWKKDELLACGALKSLGDKHAEIKSMRTSENFLRQGIAGQLLTRLLAQARKSGLQWVSLETGSQDYFEPARQLYLKYGFSFCPPFANYEEDPNSVFMSLQLV
ncbi:MAG: GNAT family N-acetyltransferase [Pseudomonadales bacterium]